MGPKYYYTIPSTKQGLEVWLVIERTAESGGLLRGTFFSEEAAKSKILELGNKDEKDRLAQRTIRTDANKYRRD